MQIQIYVYVITINWTHRKKREKKICDLCKHKREKDHLTGIETIFSFSYMCICIGLDKLIIIAAEIDFHKIISYIEKIFI